jgi:hypothetical protein
MARPVTIVSALALVGATLVGARALRRRRRPRRLRCDGDARS